MVPAPQLILRTVERLLVAAPSAKRLLRPAFYSWQNLRYRRLVSRNRILKDRFRGRRCFILGTGPSVNELDFDLLAGEHVFACSLFCKHKDFNRLQVSFYSAITPLRPLYALWVLYQVYLPSDGVRITPKNAESVLRDMFSQTGEFFPDLREVSRGPFHLFSALATRCRNPDTIWFFNASAKRFLEAQSLFTDRQAFYVMKAAPPARLAAAQSRDLAGLLTLADGNLPFAIGAAIYMGFTEIILCGCGYTYEPLQEFHFYDLPVLSAAFSEPEAIAWSRRFAEARGVTMHSLRRTDEGYRPIFVRNRSVDDIHRVIDDFARAHGVTIFNLVPEGFESPVYSPMRHQHLQEMLRERQYVHGGPILSKDRAR